MRKDERVVDLYGRYSHLGVLKLKLSKFADLKPKRFKTRRFYLQVKSCLTWRQMKGFLFIFRLALFISHSELIMNYVQSSVVSQLLLKITV